MSKYGVFSGPQFSVFGLNTIIYPVNLRLQSKYGKIRTKKNSALGHFSRSVSRYFFSLKDPFLYKFHKRIDLQNEPKANVSLIDTPKIIRQSGIEVVKEE